MPNSLSGHTTNLTDGDFILSPSFTNLYEAAHGNGILLLEDGSMSTSSLRTNVTALPGAISYSVNQITIKSANRKVYLKNTMIYMFCLLDKTIIGGLFLLILSSKQITTKRSGQREN